MLLRTEFFSALALLIGIALIVQGCATGSPAPAPGIVDAPTRATVSFAQQIAPIFEARCTECHGGLEAESGLNLSTYQGAMVGSEYGTVIEAGNPDESLIIDMIRSGSMPAQGDPMPPEELGLLRSWIAEGAQNN